MIITLVTAGWIHHKHRLIQLAVGEEVTASSSFTRLMRASGALVGTQLVATAAVSLMRPQILGRVASWAVGGEVTLDAEVERSRYPVTATR